MQAEAEEFMSKDEENTIKNYGGIKVPELDGSISENVKMRKRGQPTTIIDENRNQGCGENISICMRGSERTKKKDTRKRRPKKEKEERLENRQEDVEMRENGGEREKSKDLVEEHGGPVSAAEEGKVMEEDKYILREGDGSITENVKLRKRGRNNNENKNRGCMKHGGTEGKNEKNKKRDRLKKEDGLGNGQEDVEMRETGFEDLGVRENGCNVRDMEMSKDLVQENGGIVPAVEEGKVMQEDKDSLGGGLKENGASSSPEAEIAEYSSRKELEEEDIRGNSQKQNGKVESEGIRKSKRLATEKIERLKSTEDEDEGVSMKKKKKKRCGKKKENDQTGKIVDGKYEQRKTSCTKGTGEGERKELDVSGEPQFPSKTRIVQNVTNTRVGLKRDNNVSRIWKFINFIPLQL